MLKKGILTEYEYEVILPSDAVATENPKDIIDDIITGINKTDGKFVSIIDRVEAIHYAIDNAEAGDIILIAGKGHETYQEIKGVKHHFDDKEIILN